MVLGALPSHNELACGTVGVSEAKIVAVLSFDCFDCAEADDNKDSVVIGTECWTSRLVLWADNKVRA